MANRRPVTVDEAEITPVRPKRSGRQKGYWVYLHEGLLRGIGIDPAVEIEVMRYGARERRRRKDGTEAVRGRVILTFSIVTPTSDEEGPS